jgi:putative PIN family toxin of toxin-antitoxin system
VKLVVDTNVLIAGLVAEGLCRDIVKRRLASCELFTSPALLNELAEKMREKFDLKVNQLPFFKVYKEHATLVDPMPLAQPACRDPDDDEVLATAVCAGADIILTGDADLLVLKSFQGIDILSPRQFVELMDRFE